MRATYVEKQLDDPLLLASPGAPAGADARRHRGAASYSRLVLTKNHSADQRSNLKRAYAHYMHNAKHAGGSADNPCEQWPMRPYAASV